jgi:hypothetical protein
MCVPDTLQIILSVQENRMMYVFLVSSMHIRWRPPYER